MSELFNIMLDDIYEKIENNNKSYNIKLPDYILVKNGSKITWKNVKDFLKVMKRHPDHFFNFMNFETSNRVLWVSDSKSDGLNFLYKVKVDALNIIINKYLNEYVICKSCKMLYTKLEKDQQIRKYKLICRCCNTTYYV
jgi:translation initiation factor 2 subunit 2